MKTGDLISLAETYTAHRNLSEATVSNRVASHARLFKRLRDGKGCTLATYYKALNWFDRHWPIDLEWPSDIPRPPSEGDAG